MIYRTGVGGARTDRERPDSPLDALTESAGEQTIEEFEILGNATRMAILLVLWDAHAPFAAGNACSSSAMYDRLDVADTGNFTSHLGRLVDPFVERTDAGYSLTVRAEQFLSAVFAGTLAEYELIHGRLEGRPRVRRYGGFPGVAALDIAS